MAAAAAAGAGAAAAAGVWTLPAASVRLAAPGEVEGLFGTASPPVHLPPGAHRPHAPSPSPASPGGPALPLPSTAGEGAGEDAAGAAAAASTLATAVKKGQAPLGADGPPVQLSLFEACILLGAPAPGAGAGGATGQEKDADAGAAPPDGRPTKRARSDSAAGPDAPPAQTPVDVLMNTGGLVWAAAFCPDPARSLSCFAASASGAGAGAGAGAGKAGAGAGAGKAGSSGSGSSAALSPLAEGGAEVLAVSVHPGGTSRCRMGTPLSGAGAVQVWAIPEATAPVLSAAPPAASTGSGTGSGSGGWASSALCPQGVPRLLYALLHEGRVTWDVQVGRTGMQEVEEAQMEWHPDPQAVLAPSALQASPGSAAAAAKGAGAGKGAAAAAAGADAQQGVEGQLRALGVLALVLGDGSVQVVVAPEPRALQRLATARAAEASQGSPQGAGADQQQQQQLGGVVAAGGQQAPGVRVAPLAAISSARLGGALASSVAWRQGSQTPGLVVGCWDGSVSLWALPPGSSSTSSATAGSTKLKPVPLLAARADAGPLRRVRWHPSPGAAGGLSAVGSLDAAPAHLFMTAAQSGEVRVWDARDPTAPLFQKVMARCVLYDAVWVGGPGPNRHGVVGAWDDGCLRGLELAPAHWATDPKNPWVSLVAGYDAACLWGLDYCPPLAALAYAGDDGLVGVAAVECCPDSRSRRPHVPVGGLVSDGRGALLAVGPAQVAGVPCVFGGSVTYGGTGTGGAGGRGSAKGAAKAAVVATSELRDGLQALYAVAWSPNARGPAGRLLSGPEAAVVTGAGAGLGGVAWLAYGGAAGLLRAQRMGRPCLS